MLENQLEQQTQTVNQLRERLARVDDISGSDEDLLGRLASAKVSQYLDYLNLSSLTSNNFFSLFKLIGPCAFQISS
jgi:hypothetical protein